MSIGIGINVDARAAKDAKRDIEFLNDALKKTEALGDLAVGGENLDQLSDIVRKITEDVRRMKGVVATSERQGGVLRPEQFKEVSALSKRLGDNMAAYAKEIAKARDELNKLAQEKKRLEAIGSSGAYESPDQFFNRKSRLSDLESEIAAKQKEYDNARKNEARVRRSAQQAAEYTDALSGVGVSAPGAGRSLRRALGLGTALMGGFSIAGYLTDAMAKAAAYGAGNADLTMRGGGELVRSSYGFTPMETMEMASSLNSRLGFGGTELNNTTELAKRFARGRGLDQSAVTSYMGDIYQATGLTEKTYKEHMEKLRDAVVKSGAEGRIGEYMQLNQQLLRQVSQGIGARALTGTEIDNLTGFQAALWAMPGMGGKGESGMNIMSAIDQGIRGGGRTPGEQLFMYQALGGENVKNFKDYREFQRRKERGLGDERSFRDIYRLAEKLWGTDENGALSDFGKSSLGRAFNLSVESQDKVAEIGRLGLFSKEKAQAYLKANGGIDSDTATAFGLAGNDHRQVIADWESLKLDFGNALLPAIDSVKGAMTQGAEMFIKQLKEHPVETMVVGTLTIGGLKGITSTALTAGGSAAAGATLTWFLPWISKLPLMGPAATAAGIGLTGKYVFPLIDRALDSWETGQSTKHLRKSLKLINDNADSSGWISAGDERRKAAIEAELASRGNGASRDYQVIAPQKNEQSASGASGAWGYPEAALSGDGNSDLPDLIAALNSLVDVLSASNAGPFGAPQGSGL